MADDTFADVTVLIVDDGMFSRQTLERTLKSMGAAKDVPILVLTGQQVDARKKHAAEDLIDGFIDKPATVKALTAHMSKALGL